MFKDCGQLPKFESNWQLPTRRLQKMILKKLKLQNIRSYKEMEIEFPLGATLLAGDIGSGKTSILLALQFALFGLQPGQKGAAILRNGETDAQVSLELEINNNQIILERTLKKAKNNSISQDSNIITINNQKQELSASEMKNKVIELLDYPKEFVKKSNLLYKFTVYTPQEEMKAIIQENPDVRLDILRHIFGIDRYKRIKENIEIFLQKLKETVKLKEVEIREVNILKEKLVLETEKKIKLSKELNDLSITYQSVSEKRKNQEANLNDLQKTIEEKNKLDSELASKEAELRGKKEIKLRLEKEIILMQRQIQEKILFSLEKLAETSTLLETHKHTLDELNSKLIEANSKISVLNSKKEISLSLKDKITHLEQCPTCQQSVTSEYKDKISKRTQYDLEDIERELLPKIQEKARILQEIEKEKILIRGYEQDKREQEQSKIKFQHQREVETKIISDNISLERILGEIELIDTKIIETRSKLTGYIAIKEEYEKVKTIFEQTQREIRSFEIALAQKSKESELLKKYLDELEQEITKKEKIRKQITYLRELQDWLEDKFIQIVTVIETNVLAKLRSEFSKLLNEWFSNLVSDSLSVRLDENFTPIISNQDYEIDYDFLSGGERTAVALAYRLALNQILNSLLSKLKTKDIIILDEPTDGFSEQQLDKMRDIFEQLNSKQTIIVSHEQKIEGFVDNIIRIRKEGNSRVESSKKI